MASARDHLRAPAGAKRTKIALACQSCKKRKQKCDGSHPCERCNSHDLDCEYVLPDKPMPLGKNQYINSLEWRIAELETLLMVHGINESGDDHLSGQVARPPVTVQHDERFMGPVDFQERYASHPLAEREQHLQHQQKSGSDGVVSILRSLSLDANGSGYIGASSHVTFGQLFGFLDLDRTNTEYTHQRMGANDSLPQGQHPHHRDEPLDMSGVRPAVADRLLNGYLKHVATRYPVVHSVRVRRLHNDRSRCSGVFEKTVLHLVYATAGRFLETTGETGAFQARRHYQAAVRLLDTVLAHNDVRTVQVMMLMAIYCLRDSAGPGAWTCSRTALMIAIEHGLHRQTRAMAVPGLENELRKRLFWSCYCFDRQISIPMGRPFGISDRDIDLDPPLDIDESCDEETLMARANSGNTSGRSTSLTSFCRIIELRRIESEIQQSIYRVDQALALGDDMFDGFLDRLEHWKMSIPEDAKHFKDVEDQAYDGYDFYLVFYYKCQRLLLFPALAIRSETLRYREECARACAGVCGAYKRLHQSLAVGYSTMALQTVFMAGLTLVYCLWLSPDEMFSMATSTGINDCSILLFVITERVPAAKGYRDAFEAIRQEVINRMVEEPRRPVTLSMRDFTTDLAPGKNRDSNDIALDRSSLEQLSQIVADMTGETLPSEAPAPRDHPARTTFDDDLSGLFDLSGL